MRFLSYLTTLLIAVFLTACGGGGSVGTSSTIALFTTAASNVNLLTNEKATFLIGGGSAPYLVTSSNAAAVAVAYSTSSLTLTGLISTAKMITTASGATSITFVPAVITVRDSIGAVLSFNVNVGTDLNAQLVVSPETATGNIGDSVNFILSGGVAPYQLTVNKPSIANLPESVGRSGNVFTAVLNNVGDTLVTITDKLNTRIILNLKVQASSPILRLSPSALEISEDSKNPFILNIYGGTGPYTAFASNLKNILATVTTSAAGPIVTVSVPQEGTRCFTSDSPGGVREVKVTVVDFLGASANTIITIRDNTVAGSGCGSP